MSSLGGILPIPEQTIVGTGTYVIPANRYGKFCGNTSASVAGNSYLNGTSTGGVSGLGSGATSNSHNQDLVAGDTITVSNTAPSGSNASANVTSFLAYARILINGTPVCLAYARGAVGSTWNTVMFRVWSSSVVSGWSVALFRIPIGNLPQGAAEGEA